MYASTFSKQLPNLVLYQASNQLQGCLCVQMQTDNLELDSKLLGDCLMSLAVFQAWQEPLYTHMVAQARSLPMAAYGPRSLRQTYQVSQTCNYGYTG